MIPLLFFPIAFVLYINIVILVNITVSSRKDSVRLPTSSTLSASFSAHRYYT